MTGGSANHGQVARLLGMLVAGVVALSTAAAAPASAYDSPDAAQAAAAQLNGLASVESGWTGSVDSCAVGTESAASLDATLRAVDLLRAAAGVGPVAFDPTLDQKALAAEPGAWLKSPSGLAADGPRSSGTGPQASTRPGR